MSLDSYIKFFLDEFNKLSFPLFIPVSKGREDYLHFALFHAGWPLKLARVEDHVIPASDGYQIPIRIYTPIINKKLPVLIYNHGGGWQRGDLATHDSICRHLAHHSECIIVAVEWRLAPEYQFPVGVVDSLDVYKWILKHGVDFHMNTSSVGIGGDSAGGNLTTSVFQKIKAEKLPQPQFQLLLYPSLDLACTSDSYEKYAEGYFLSTEHVKKYVSEYLPSQDDLHNPLASPILQKDVSYLPRTHIVYAGYDPLRGDSEKYVDMLKKAGVNVSSKCYEGMIHAFLHMNHTVPAVADALKEIAAVVKEALSD